MKRQESSAVYVAHSLKGKCGHAPVDASHADACAQTPFPDLSQDPASEPNFLSPIKLDEHPRFTDVYRVSPHLASCEVEDDRCLETESKSASDNAVSGGAHSVHL